MHDILKDKSVIFFDVGYTIDYPPTGDWMLINKFYEICGDRFTRHSKDEIRKAVMAASRDLAQHHILSTEEEEVWCFCRFYRIMSDVLEMGLTDEEVTEISEDRTYNMDNYLIYPDAKKVIEELSKTHLLGVISDTWPSIKRQLKSFDLDRFFSFETYSFEFGLFKPDPKMYLDALEKCGRDAAETVFIDDRPANLDGAAKLGITPILIAANPASDVDTPYLKIHSLSDLIDQL